MKIGAILRSLRSVAMRILGALMRAAKRWALGRRWPQIGFRLAPKIDTYRSPGLPDDWLSLISAGD